MSFGMRRLSWLVMGMLPFALVGCGEERPATPVVKEENHSAHDGHDHGAEAGGHPTEGPHHGHLIELGAEEYHAELTHDDKTNSVTIYLLDKDAKKPVASADKELALNLVVDGKPLQKKIPAQQETGEKEGESSRYVLEDKELLEALEAEKTTGRLNVTIAGKEYSGVVAHSGHEGHQH